MSRQIEAMIEELAKAGRGPGLCPYRDKCLVPIKRRVRKQWVNRVVPRSELTIPCGFEMAGTVAGCPKAKRWKAEGGDDDRDCGLGGSPDGDTTGTAPAAGVDVSGR